MGIEEGPAKIPLYWWSQPINGLRI